MSDYKTNPIFKQLLTEISSKASTGRIDLSWGKLAESKRTLKTELKNENPDLDKEPDEDPQNPAPDGAEPAAGKASTDGGSTPAPSGVPAKAQAPSQEAPGQEAPQAQAAAPTSQAPGQEVDKAKEDATVAQAELEKAKAEKAQAEKELETQSYIHLVSPGGVSFLLGKLLDQAFKTNKIDALAAEIVQKLKIQGQEEFQLFSDEMIPFKNIPGAAELLTTMSGVVGKE